MKRQTPDLILSTLSNLGVDYLFHLPGISLAGLYESLGSNKKIKSVLFKHEQAACFAAAGYSLLTGRPGVCMVMCGPGITNLVSALTECYYQSIPVLVITVDNPRKYFGKEEFHELDSFSMLKPVTKKIFSPKTVSAIQKELAEALSCTVEGRPGPVYFNVSVDLIPKVSTVKDVRLRVKIPCPPLSRVKKALQIIRQSRNPVIFAGSGIKRSKAEKELREFVRLTGIPIFTSIGGRGIVPEGTPPVMGMFPYNFNTDFLNISDLIIVLGTRTNTFNLRLGKLKLPERQLRVDINEKKPEPGKFEIYIKADARKFLEAANHEIRTDKNFSKTADNTIYVSYLNAFNQFKTAEQAAISKRPSSLTTKKFLLQLSEFLKDREFTLFTDSTSIIFPHLLPAAEKPHDFFSIGSFGCLGFSFPAAIGASFTHKKKKIISLSGDGSFLFNCQELSTAATYRLKNLIQIVLNNDGYSSLYLTAAMKNSRKKEYYLWNRVHYGCLAESFGIKYITLDSPSKIKKALSKAFSGTGPFLINVVTNDKEYLKKEDLP